jgi:tRNA-specific 2-thiouridylase
MLGMSGGVDSSVAAALLLKQGYEVIGVTMEIWPEQSGEENVREGGCCSLSAVDDARRVANLLGIPYYVLNFRDQFEKCVIEDFVSEYKKGRTPNPCLVCNRKMKFEAMLEKALSMGIDRVATGHYARIIRDDNIGKYKLIRAIDQSKDQTYALYQITQEQLEHFLFPVGGYSKTDIRQIAAKYDLPVFNKPDSQEICFIPDNNYSRFINDRTGETEPEGHFVSTDGSILGTHKGISGYTIGQRKGVGSIFGKPMHVVSIDPLTNDIVLGDRGDVYSSELTANAASFIYMDPKCVPELFRADVKIRYSAKPAPATIHFDGKETFDVNFDEPQWAVTPGQSAVFYDGDTVIGGGIITGRTAGKGKSDE